MIGEAWWWLEPQILRLVKRAHGEFTVEGLKSQAVSGDILVWVVTSATQTRAPLATLLTRLEKWSGETVCRVYGVAGSLHAILATKDAADQRMREMGATRAVFEGRFGWLRIFKDYKPMKIVMGKRL